MPEKCFVPGCSTGYASDVKQLKLLGKPIPSLFKPPQIRHSLYLQ